MWTAFDDLYLKLYQPSEPCEIKFSLETPQGILEPLETTQGILEPGQTETVYFWLKITDGAPGPRNGFFILYTSRGDAVIQVSAEAYRPAQMGFTDPQLHPLNNKVNLASNTRVSFKVNEASPNNPDASVIGYRWQKVVFGDNLSEFETSNMPEYPFTFNHADDWTVYCKSVEKANNIEVESDLIEIPTQ